MTATILKLKKMFNKIIIFAPFEFSISVFSGYNFVYVVEPGDLVFFSQLFHSGEERTATGIDSDLSKNAIIACSQIPNSSVYHVGMVTETDSEGVINEAAAGNIATNEASDGGILSDRQSLKGIKIVHTSQKLNAVMIEPLSTIIERALHEHPADDLLVEVAKVDVEKKWRHAAVEWAVKEKAKGFCILCPHSSNC